MAKSAVALPLLAMLLAASGSSGSAGAATIDGTVHAPDGSPTGAAHVRLLELGRRTAVGPDGAFRFDQVPDGVWLLEASSAAYGQVVEAVDLSTGEDVRLELQFRGLMHRDEITVTASAEVRSVADVAQPVSVVAGRELELREEATLGRTLDHEAGVTSTYFGPGSSRPVIRGLGGDRIRILEGGLGIGDISETSPDHAVSAAPGAAARIEVVRGPATLLYGSSAVGGVVNVIEERVPAFRVGEAVTGALDLEMGTAADMEAGLVSLSGDAGGLVWHLEAARRTSGDVEIPGFAVSGREEHEDEDEEGAYGVLPNSAAESDLATFGLAWVGAHGHVGLAYTAFDTLFGIPGGHGHGDEGEPDGPEEDEGHGGVRSDLSRRRLELEADHRVGGFIDRLRLRAARTDYQHDELEGDEVGTRFSADGWEARLEAVHRPLGGLSGVVGVQALERDFRAVGEEAFIVPNTTRSFAAFLFEEIGVGEVDVQVGVRAESQEVSAELPLRPRRRDTAVSASAGVVARLGRDLVLAGSLARSVKLPNAEELFSDGPHTATRAYEIGDPTLDEEVSLGADLSLRKVDGRVTGELTGFVNRFDSFMFADLTGEQREGLDVLRYVQADARFYGAEAEAWISLVHRAETHLRLRLMADLVRADLTDSGEPLPRIPPWRLGAGLEWEGRRLWAWGEVRRVAAQDRIAAHEETTEGFTMVNAAVGYRILSGHLAHDLILRASNLLDEEARLHTSFLKEVAPLPGRDLRLVYRATF